MKDRLACTPVTLSNGIKVYLYQRDIPFVSLRYIVPFGHKHNRGDVRAGSFHFLEHLALNRSTAFPQHDSFSRFIGLHGGYVNAYTTYRSTVFEVSFPTTIKQQGLGGFFAQLFENVFDESDIVRETAVIKNERRRKERWYPGTSEISHYLHTKWRYRDPKFLYTIFGSDKDHRSYSLAYFEKLKERYKTTSGYVIAAGNITLDEIRRHLEPYHTVGVPTGEIADPDYTWKHPAYSERSFDDESRYEYRIGGHFGPLTFEDFFYLKFLGNYLFGSVQGPIYQWLRDQKGWLYEIRFGFDYEHSNTPWTVVFPLTTIDHVDQVRAELLDRIRIALGDERCVQEKITRMIGKEVFQYQHVDEVIEDAEVFLSLFGKTGSEEEIRSIIRTVTVEKLQRFFEERIMSKPIGEILTMPRKRIDVFGVRKTVRTVMDEINELLTMPKRKVNKQLIRIKRQLRKLM